MPKLAIDQIEATAATQVRVKIDPAIVDEYAAAIEAGKVFPAIICFTKDGDSYILADGFHRLAAASKLGRKTIGVEVHKGGLHEALEYALSANADHGLRRSSADKAHAVQMALKDPHYSELSLRKLADLCAVSHETVRRMKEKQENGTQKVTPRNRKEPPSQNDIDRKELLGALATIRSFPFKGDSAWHRLKLIDSFDEIAFCYDWLGEVIDQHRKEEDGPSE